MNASLRDFDWTLTRRQALAALSSAALSAAAPARLHAADQASPDWNAIAREFLIPPQITYLNTGSLGSTPKPVLEARREIERRLEANPAGEGFGPVLREAEAVAAKVAELIGCRADEVTITRNATEGVNFVAEGINLRPGQRVLTSDNEHGGGLGAWRFLKKSRGIEIDVAEIPSPPQSEDQIVENFRQALRPETRVIFCSHVTFSNGVRVPIARLSELAHQHGCLMIADGAQSAGGIPVNVTQLGCDAFVASGHKFLLGPKGTGLLYIRAAAREEIKPMQLDEGYAFYTGIRGTSCMPEVIGLGNVLEWFRAIGHDAVLQRLMDLRNQFDAVLREMPHVKIDSPSPDSPLASHLVCFRITDRDRYAKLQDRFAKDQIVVKTVGINGIDYRLSVQLYNTETDVKKFATGLQQGLT